MFIKKTWIIFLFAVSVLLISSLANYSSLQNKAVESFDVDIPSDNCTVIMVAKGASVDGRR